MNNILLLASHPTSLRVMIPLSRYIQEQGEFNPILLVLGSDQVLADELEKTENNFEIISISKHQLDHKEFISSNFRFLYQLNKVSLYN